jgi:hypothetical protein
MKWKTEGKTMRGRHRAGKTFRGKALDRGDIERRGE